MHATVVVIAALGLLAGTARAGETVFTDTGWYRVEGSAPTPLPGQGPGTLTVEPAPPSASPVPGQAPPRLSESPMAGPIREVPLCLAQRGALVRRLLALHGLELSRVAVSDRALGGLGTAAWGAPLPFAASLSLSPDLNLLAGGVPLPPSSVNWDGEAQWDWQALLQCQARL